MPSTYQAISSTTLGSAQASVTFTSFGGYTDLILQMTPQTSDGSGYFQVFFNGDTLGSSTSYSRTVMYGTGTGSGTSNRNSNSGNGLQMNCATNSQDVNSYPTMIQIMNYANTNTYKTSLARAGSPSVGLVEDYVWLYRSTSAITQIVVQANSTTFTAGSVFTIYGIKAA